MTAMPDDAGSCVRHQSERGEDGGAERLFFFLPEIRGCCRFWHSCVVAESHICLVCYK